MPEDGRMPRAVVDAEGTVHLVYVQGGTNRANLFHATREPGEPGWSEPQQVNSQELSVSGVGPIDGAQLALGSDNRLHVVWLQSEPPRFFYTRSHAGRRGFEPQRDLSTGKEGSLEAGPAVAVDEGGNVYVFWHAGADEDARRRVYLTVSRDGGTTFEPPRPVSSAAEGACACCGLAAMSDPGGAVHVSYRGAGDNVRRGQRLLTSTDHGRTFSDRLVDPWELGACPVSTTKLFAGPAGLTAAWETRGDRSTSPTSTGWTPCARRRDRRGSGARILWSRSIPRVIRCSRGATAPASVSGVRSTGSSSTSPAGRWGSRAVGRERSSAGVRRPPWFRTAGSS